MAIEAEGDMAAGIAVLGLSAPLSVQPLCSALDEHVAHPDFRAGMNMLAVLDPGSIARISLADIGRISDYETS
jgi:hypothetical protein